MPKTRWTGRTAFLAAACLSISASSFAAPPQKVLYQGTLRRSGAVYTGNATFVFRLTDSSGGTEYWTSGSTVVAVSMGLFRYPLGVDNAGGTGLSGKPLSGVDWPNITPYIEVTVDGTVLTPREAMASVPYALSNEDTTKLPKAGGAMTGPLTLSGSTLTVSGGAFSVGGSTFAVFSGRVGIGTTNPSYSLDIQGDVRSTGVFVGSGAKLSGLNFDGAPAATGMTLYNDGGTLKWNGSALAVGSSVSGTTGFVPKFTDATSLGNSVLFESGGNVGVGTTVPGAKLDVSGSARFGSGSTKSTFTSTGDLILAPGSSVTLSGANGFIASGSSITASAFFGYGGNLTGLPSSETNTYASSKTFTSSVLSGASVTASAFFGYGGNLTGISAGELNTYTSSKTFTANAFSVGGSTLVVSGGNVGVGTSAPASQLHINGTGGAQLNFYGHWAGNYFVQSSSGGLVLESWGTTAGPNPNVYVRSSRGTGTGKVYINDVANDVILANGGGLVGIGTANPAATLEVNGSAQFGAGSFKSTFTSVGALILASGSSITLSGANGFITSASSVTASAFFGSGAGLTGVAASQMNAAGLINGPVNSSILPSTVAYTSSANTFSSSQTITANAFSVGVSTFVVAGGNIGVGTVSPATTLDVNGSAQFGAGSSKSTFTTTGALALAGNAALTLSGASGNIATVSSVTASAFFGSGAALTGIPSTASISGTYVAKGGDTMTGQLSVSGSSVTIVNATTADSYSLAVTSASNRSVYHLVVSTMGMVGIGTSSPTQALDIYGGNLVVNNGYLLHQGMAAAASWILFSNVVGDTFQRYVVAADGKHGWGPGNSGRDTWLYRASPGVLRTDAAFNVGGQAIIVGTMTVQGSDFSVGGSNLVVASGNVGIGTSAPGAALHVSSGATSATTPIFIVSTGAAASEELLRVQKNGNIGVGVSNPSYSLQTSSTVLFANMSDVSSDVEYGRRLYVSRRTSLGESLAIYVSDNNVYFRSEQDETTGTGGGFRFLMDSDGTLDPSFKVGLKSGGTEMLTVRRTGNVGIETTGPAARLHVSSVNAIASDTLLQISSGVGAGQELLVVKGDGKVGIGTSSPSSKLHVSNGAIAVEGTGAGITIGGFSVLTSSSAASLASTQTFSGQNTFTAQANFSNALSTQALFTGFAADGGASVESGQIQIGSSLRGLRIQVDNSASGSVARIENPNSGPISICTGSGASRVCPLQVGGGVLFDRATSTQAVFQGFSSDGGAHSNNGMIKLGAGALNGMRLQNNQTSGEVFIENMDASPVKLCVNSAGVRECPLQVTGTGIPSFSVADGTAAYFNGYSAIAGVANARNGSIKIGGNENEGLRLDANTIGTADMTIENLIDSSSADLDLATRGSGTRLINMKLAGTGAVQILPAGGGPATPFQIGTSTLVVTSAGNVGIGTTAPTSKLHLSSGVIAVDGIGAGITIGGFGVLTSSSAASLTSTQTFSGENTFTAKSAFANALSTQAVFSGYSAYSGSGANRASVMFGAAAATSGRIDYDGSGVLHIDNTSDGLGNNIEFRTRTANPATLNTNLILDGYGDVYSTGGQSNSTQYGSTASASGIWATAIGYGANAQANEATALGATAIAGIDGVALGYNSQNTERGVAAGAVARSGSYGVAVGNNASATGYGQIAVGYAATTTDNQSIAIGYNTQAAGGGTIIGAEARAMFAGAAIGYGSRLTAAGQFVSGADAAAISNVYFGKGVYSATPANYTIHGTSGSGTDIAGGAITLSGGEATGNAAGGSLIFQTSQVGASGVAPQTATTRMAIGGNGNVGIGTTNPGALLTVRSTSTTGTTLNLADSAGASVLSVSNYGGTVINAPSLAPGTTVFYIKEKAVGGETAPTMTIEMYPDNGLANGDTYAGLSLRRRQVGGQPSGKLFQVEHFYGPAFVIREASYFPAVGIGTWTPNVLNTFQIGVSTLVVRGASGSVGIGTSSPDSKLHVSNGAITVDGAGAGITIGGYVVLTASTSAGLTSTQTFSGQNTFTSQVSMPGSGASSERLGASASATSPSGVALGNGAQALAGGTGAVAVGSGASATARAVSLGYGATSIDLGTALGYSANATGGSVAVGHSATTAGGSGVALGYGSSAGGSGAVSVGNNSIASANNAVAIGYNSYAGYEHSIVLGRNANATAANQFIAGSPNYAISTVYFGGGSTATSPTAYTIQGTGGDGSNVAGAALQLAGGQGTGNAMGGAIIFKSAAGGASGTSLNNQTESMRISSAGFVGIGTSNVGSNRLFVSLASDTSAALKVEGYGGNSGISKTVIIEGNVDNGIPSGDTRALLSLVHTNPLGGSPNGRAIEVKGSNGAESVNRDVFIVRANGDSFFNGNMGLGTTAPGTSRLFIRAAANTGKVAASLSSYPDTGGTYLSFGDESANNFAIGLSSSDAAGAFTFNSGRSVASLGSERMRITSTGNVGIGTANPANKLHLSSGTLYVDGASSEIFLRQEGQSSRFTAEGLNGGYFKTLQYTDPNGYNFFGHLGAVNGAYAGSNEATILGPAGWSFVDGNTNLRRIKVYNTGDITFNSDSATASTMTAAGSLTLAGSAFSVGGSTFSVAGGRIGISTVTPTSKLHIHDGDIRISTTAGGASRGIIFQDGTSQTTAASGSGLLRQFVSSTTCGLYAAQGTGIPADDTVPQIGEGYKILVATITPTAADSRLEIEASIWAREGSNVDNDPIVATLFQDNGPSAIAVGLGPTTNSFVAGPPGTTVLVHIIDSTGNTTQRNFTINIGATAANAVCVNCSNANTAIYGGKACSTLTVKEYSP